MSSSCNEGITKLGTNGSESLCRGGTKTNGGSNVCHHHAMRESPNQGRTVVSPYAEMAQKQMAAPMDVLAIIMTAITRLGKGFTRF